MTMAQIRQQRGVPAKRGMRVLFRYNGNTGVIKSGRADKLWILFDGDKFALPCHPTWMLDYLDNDGNVIKST